MKAGIRISIIAIRLALGGLFIYGGIHKFIPKERPAANIVQQDLTPEAAKMKSFIGGLKQTGYFWPMLGIVELTAGLLLVSQYLSLLGAVLLMPLTLNILMFHLYLKPNDTGDLVMSTLYFLGNCFLLAYHYPDLKKTFLQLKPL